MTHSEHLALTLFLAREVARLHGLTAALSAVVEELRVTNPQPSAIDAAQIQKAQWQAFYEHLEKLNPKVAAHLDNRSKEAME